MRKAYTLEACVDSVESAIAAAQGGANRLELCANLVIGGTTPTLAMFKQVKKRTGLKINVLIRPRFGDFCYTPDEVEVMCNDIKRFKRAGANGVVFGCLNADGTLDYESMKKLKRAAGGMFTTMHRAFDVCLDPYTVLNQAKQLKINAILTSGRKNVCLEALDTFKKLTDEAGRDIQILAGGIAEPAQVEAIINACGTRHFHLSGHKVFDSPMTYRTDVYMGAPGIAEFDIYKTVAENIKTAHDIIESKLK